jgi:3-isopropylmalate dehydratase small subunit
VLPLELDGAGADAVAARVVAADGSAPFTVDLVAQTISGPGGSDINFDIAPAERMRLLEGLDDIGLTLKHADEIAAWERRTATDQPWLQSAPDSRLVSRAPPGTT